jgi:hypothetical protein
MFNSSGICRSDEGDSKLAAEQIGWELMDWIDLAQEGDK